MEMDTLVLVQSGKGLHARSTTGTPTIRLDSQPRLLISFRGKVCQFIALHFGLCIAFEMGLQAGVQLHYLDNLVVIMNYEVGSSLVSTLRATLTDLSEPRGGHQSGEVRPQAFQHSLVSQDADRHHPRECLPNGLSDCQISELVDKFLLLPTPPA